MPFSLDLPSLARFAKRRVPEIAGVLILLSAVATAMCVVEYRQQSEMHEVLAGDPSAAS